MQTIPVDMFKFLIKDYITRGILFFAALVNYLGVSS